MSSSSDLDLHCPFELVSVGGDTGIALECSVTADATDSRPWLRRVFETRAEVCSRCSAEGMVYKQLRMLLQALRHRSHGSCMAQGTVLSCPNISFPEEGVSTVLPPTVHMSQGRAPAHHSSYLESTTG